MEFLTANGTADQNPSESSDNAFDIVSVNNIRLPSQHSLAQQPNQFFRIELQLPPDLAKVAELPGKGRLWLSDYELHKEFKKCLNLISVYYEHEKRSLICLGFSQENYSFVREQTFKRMVMLSTPHFKKLKEIYQIMLSEDVIERERVVKFHIGERLLGLAIGRSGATINAARKIKGIRSVEVEECDNVKAIVIRGISHSVSRPPPCFSHLSLFSRRLYRGVPGGVVDAELCRR